MPEALAVYKKTTRKISRLFNQTTSYFCWRGCDKMQKNRNTMQLYDVLIIGAGPCGLAVGIEATKAGLSHIILEKRKHY
ncbi:MAG: NAD(P)-binding domain-containing protein [Spirosomataceae bacterium]